MKAPANGAAAKPPLPIATSTRCSPRWRTRRCAPRTAISKHSTIVWRDGVGKNALLARSNTVCWLPSISCFAITGPTRILVLTTLINSILNNEFVTMSADSENSDKEWSFHLSLMQRKPPPQPNFRRRARKKPTHVSEFGFLVSFVLRERLSFDAILFTPVERSPLSSLPRDGGDVRGGSCRF